MQIKQEVLSDFPDEVLKLISIYMDDKAINKWAMTCDKFYTLFRPERKDLNFLLSPFLICVARGEQDPAEKLLKIDGVYD